MARGQQKIQSQQKAAEKAAKAKKQAGHSAKDQKNAAMAALKSTCVVCKVNYIRSERRIEPVMWIRISLMRLRIHIT